MMYGFTRMWQHARKLPLLAAVLTLLGTAVSHGQGAPPVLPDHTVYGRLGTGTGSGPAQAIPFATISSLISSSLIVGTTTVGSGINGQFLYNNSGILGNAALGTMSTQNANAVAITGGTITGLPSPSVSTDAANKAYVDAVAIGLTIHTQVSWATTTVLPNTPNYNNGTAGVGATLTATSNIAIVVDGGSPSSSDRVLVKNQVTAAQNGIYTVTTVGDGSHAWVLTRATDFNTATSGNMAEGAYFFVGEGTTNIASSWVFVTTGAITIGTTALSFTQFSNGSGGPWNVSGSNVYYTAGNVGVGTASPLELFQVHVGTNQNIGVTSTSGVTALSSYNDAGNASVPLSITSSNLQVNGPFNGSVYATCKNAAGDGAIIQTAVNTGLAVVIVGPCVLDSAITISTSGQAIGGYGPSATVLTQSSILGTGSFICSTGEPGPYFHDFQLNFVQPNTTVRANLTQYNPAFACRATPRAHFERIKIQAAMVAFDLQGNSGGDFLTEIEASAFNAAVLLDGSLDTVRISNSHFWPFGLNANLLSIYNQYGVPGAGGGLICNTFTGTVGICIGRVDGLQLSNVLFFEGGPQIFGLNGTGGPGGTSWSTGNAFMMGSNVDFDTNSAIFWDQTGTAYFTSSTFAQAAGAFSLDMESGSGAAGAFSCSACFFFPTSTAPVIINNGSVTISGSTIAMVAGTNIAFALLCPGSCSTPNLTFTGNTILTTPSTTYTTLITAFTGSNVLTVVGNTVPITPGASSSGFNSAPGVVRNVTSNACVAGWITC